MYQALVGIRVRLPPPAPLFLWMDAGYTGEGKGADWVEKTLGWTAQIIVHHPPKLAADEVMRVWVREWTNEGVAIEWKKLLPPKGSRTSYRGGG
jgi:hypothetical protein